MSAEPRELRSVSSTGRGPQLSFAVDPHPDLVGRPNLGLIGASMKVKGEFDVGRDFNHGDELEVRIIDGDGNLIAQGVIEVQPPSFVPIVHESNVIGMERAHTGKLVDS